MRYESQRLYFLLGSLRQRFSFPGTLVIINCLLEGWRCLGHVQIHHLLFLLLLPKRWVHWVISEPRSSFWGLPLILMLLGDFELRFWLGLAAVNQSFLLIDVWLRLSVRLQRLFPSLHAGVIRLHQFPHAVGFILLAYLRLTDTFGRLGFNLGNKCRVMPGKRVKVLPGGADCLPSLLATLFFLEFELATHLVHRLAYSAVLDKTCLLLSHYFL